MSANRPRSRKVTSGIVPARWRTGSLTRTCAALRVARDALRCVDRRAERMAAPLKHLAHVEPDADADVLRGVLAAVLFQRLVDRDGAGDRLPGREEGDHEAVADRVDLAPAVLGDRLADDAAVALDRLSCDLVAHAMGEVGRAHDVGEHQGEDAGVELVDCHHDILGDSPAGRGDVARRWGV